MMAYSFWWDYFIAFFFTQFLLRSGIIVLDDHWTLVPLFKGLLWDMLTWSLLSLPGVLFITILPSRIWNKNFLRRVESAFFFCFLFSLLFITFSEAMFWQEFRSRFNFIAVDYLVYTNEVLHNVTESFPVMPIMLGMLGITLLTTYFRHRLRNGQPFFPPTRFLSRPAFFMWWALLLPCILLMQVLPWLDAPVHDYHLDQVARNGVFEFVQAFRNNRIDWNVFYATVPEKKYEALHKVMPPVERRMNVVFIVVESLGAKFIGPLGGIPGATPELNKLAGESLFFTHLYSSGTRTVRGLEALTLSVPTTPGYAVVKRPSNHNLASMGAVFKDHGYENTFLYGGLSYFDNMKTFFIGNSFKVVDQADFTDEETHFSNAWGVCDDDLFEKEIKLARTDASKKSPFLHFLLTTSNHRPFTYPDKGAQLPSGTSRLGAVQYTDAAIGRFLERARKESWSSNTIFVIVADHSTEGRGRFALDPADFHIPLWIWSPGGQVAKGKYEKLMAQIDVLPTLLGLLGLSWEAPFFGQDVFSDHVEERAFIGNYQYVGLLKPDTLTVLGPKKTSISYRFGRKGELQEIDTNQDLLTNAVLPFQRASYLLDHDLYHARTAGK